MIICYNQVEFDLMLEKEDTNLYNPTPVVVFLFI